MKKLLAVIIVCFLIFGITLNAKTDEKTVPNVTRSIVEIGTGL